MAWTYGEDPAANTKDEVRFLLGDTDQNDPHASDEEINYLLGKYGDPHIAAAAGAEALASKYTGLIDRSVGTLSISYSQKATQFAATAERLRKQSRSPDVVAASGAGPLIFGIAWEEKDDKDADTTLIPDTFDLGIHDNLDVESDVREV